MDDGVCLWFEVECDDFWCRCFVSCQDLAVLFKNELFVGGFQTQDVETY